MSNQMPAVSNQVTEMGQRLNINPVEMKNILMSTVMPTGKDVKVTNEQLVSFLAVANEYKLNPLTKEIYAFPTKGGGIQPIVSIDGWLKIINNHKEFDGMEFVDNVADGQLFSVTCRIYRKDRARPIEVTEYMDECAGDATDRNGNTTPWGRWPARMLRHKATIQAARYAFGLSGIIDPDEAERFEKVGAINKPKAVESKAEYCSPEKFAENADKWRALIESGKKDVNSLIAAIETKAILTDDQKLEIASWSAQEVQYEDLPA